VVWTCETVAVVGEDIVAPVEQNRGRGLLLFGREATIVGDMDGTDFLPNDLAECQRLLLAAFKQATQLERRVTESEQRAAEQNRVLEETAASYQELQQEHAATLDELEWYKRWAYGRRRERFVEDQGQGHLFELDLELGDQP